MSQVTRLVVGTRNAKKLEELRALLADLPINVVSVGEFADAPEVEEDGDTFEANAVKKATVLAKALGEWVIADDSGLAVDALDGRPGVLSARYGGPGSSDEAKVAKLLGELAGVPDEGRTAHFHCVIALASPQGLETVAEGQCDGVIATEPVGQNGFGYDPVFLYPPIGKTFAQIGSEAKHRVSHRGQALGRFREKAAQFFR